MTIIQPAMIPIAIHGCLYELANGMVRSAMLGWKKLSPSSAVTCTTIAVIVASERASCATRTSATRRFSSLPPMRRPRPTETLDVSSAAVPAARLVIQKKCPPRSVASIGILRTGWW